MKNPCNKHNASKFYYANDGSRLLQWIILTVQDTEWFFLSAKIGDFG